MVGWLLGVLLQEHDGLLLLQLAFRTVSFPVSNVVVSGLVVALIPTLSQRQFLGTVPNAEAVAPNVACMTSQGTQISQFGSWYVLVVELVVFVCVCFDEIQEKRYTRHAK